MYTVEFWVDFPSLPFLLCGPVDCSLPGSSDHGIFQARILEWVAISFSNARKWKVKVKSLSGPTLSSPMDCSLPGSSDHGIFQASVLEWGAIAFSATDCSGFIYFFLYKNGFLWVFFQDSFLSGSFSFSFFFLGTERSCGLICWVFEWQSFSIPSS